MPQTALAIAADVRTGKRRAAEVCAEALQRIRERDPELRAFISTCEDYARQRAAGIDADVAAGRPVGPLAGVPVALKDNICTRFARTTAASRILAEFQPPYDATVTQRLEAAGAVIIGKTNMDEFAMGSSTENSSYFATRNPWKRDCVPGGSSGGSAAAVAGGMASLACGSDTGGSIRQPAALCGCVGLKPTYGRVSRYGLLAYGSSLDQIGPLAANVLDAALLLGVIAGEDPLDTTSAPQVVPGYVQGLGEGDIAERLRGLRIGVPREYFAAGLDREVAAAVEAAIAELERLGARRVEVSLPRAKYCVATYYLIATAEASSNLARYDGVHYGLRVAAPDITALTTASRSAGFGTEVKRRLMLGTFALSAGYYDAYYHKALRVRRLMKDDFDRAFGLADVLISPTTPTAAFCLGEKSSDPLAMYLADIYTIAANLAGLPAISIPCGFSAGGLPIGLQLTGGLFDELRLLQVARAYERETTWHTRSPSHLSA